VAANLLRPLLLAYASRLVAPLPERLIASGLLREEGDEIAAAFGPHGLEERERRESGEWAALLLERRVSS
jgi:ribosomal protein L11 methylase PrmA